MTTIIKEYRILMPMTVEEYNIGQLYSVAKISRENTKNSEGVRVVKNEPIEDGSGQYTQKIYEVGKTLMPWWITAIMPRLKNLTFVEKSWNRFPICKTTYFSDYFGEDFSLVVDTIHQDDSGTSENVHKLSDEDLARREVVWVDISSTDDLKSKGSYSSEKDPGVLKSVKTGRGPLLEGWANDANPIMCCYKLVRVDANAWWMPSKLARMTHDNSQSMMLEANRDMFVWIDEWIEMTMADIRKLEDEVQEELAKIFDEGDEKKDNEKDGDKTSSKK